MTRNNKNNMSAALIARRGLQAITITAVLCGCRGNGEPAVAGSIDIPAGAEPMPGQIIVDDNNPTWFRYAGGGAHFLAGVGDPEDFFYRGALMPDGTRQGDQAEIIRSLADAGVNGIYFQAVRSHGGDGDDTHNPFLGHDPGHGLNTVLLDQWVSWLHALDANGIVSYFFFYDDNASVWETSDDVGDEERDFIVALVKRFQSIRHLVWVIAEEYQERFTPVRVSRLAQLVREADEYAHPIAVHKLDGLEFAEFANDPNIDQFAMQYNVVDADEFNEGMTDARRLAAGRYNLNMSEALNFGSGAELREKAWAVALGGAYVMVLYPGGAPLPRNDLEDLGRLAAFMESTGFTAMRPANERAGGDARYALADMPREAIVFAVASPARRVALDGLAPGGYRLRWFGPGDGRETVQEVDVAAAAAEWQIPAGFDGQVVLHVAAKAAEANRAPVVADVTVETRPGRPLPLRFTFLDPDGPGPYAASVLDGPRHGTLSGSGVTRAYQPVAGFAGEDRIEYSVSDGVAESGTAVIRVVVRAASANVAPVAISQTVAIDTRSANDIFLRYTDADGPGPYRVELAESPAQGQLIGVGNDWVYTPSETFTGADRFTWRVSDGVSSSNTAVVEIQAR